LAPTLAFTDGSCVRNGRPDAEAGYAVHYWAGPLRGVELRGRVAPCEYAFVDPSEPRLGFVPSAGAPATPTNNRGEYLAWCWCLLLLLRAGGRGAAEVVSDCNLFIRTMEEWLPARRARGTERELKNYDLVAVGAALLAALRGQIGLGPRGVELTHIRSHRKRPSAASGRRAQILWAGNDRADRGAKQALGPALKDPAAPLLITHSPALHWALWGRWGGTGRPGALAPEREA
jgi:ribonuclease HI